MIDERGLGVLVSLIICTLPCENARKTEGQINNKRHGLTKWKDLCTRTVASE